MEMGCSGSHINIKNNIKLKSNDNVKIKRIEELDERKIHLVRESWKELCRLGDFKLHGINMMIRILMNHKEIKHVWKFAAMLETEEDMRQSAQLKSHGNNVFEVINAAVNSLDKPDVLKNLLIELGRRHINYGTKIEYFPIIREGLFGTLADALGPKFTDEHYKAWNSVFDDFCENMVKGMEQ